MKRLMIFIITMFLLVGCSLPGLGVTRGEGIVISSGNTTERQINSEIIAQMVSHHIPEMEVDILSNLGSSILVLQSMTRKDADISSAMYTGTSLTGELNMEATTDVDEAFEKVVKGYYEQFDIVWFPSYGFANSYAFMVTEEFSQEHNVTKVSDLEEIADSLRAGIDTGWIDRDGDGYEAFKELYGFDFNEVLPMEIGLVYNAVQNNEMDVVLGYSTDGRIDAYNLVVLEDDLQLFPPYDASLVLSVDMYEKHPELVKVLLMLEGAISPDDMQALNRRSDEDKVEPRTVAKEFLEENNYFEGKEVTPLETRPLYKELLGDLSD